MFNTLSNYVRSLAFLGGKRFLEHRSVSGVLLEDDMHVIRQVQMRLINSDGTLAAYWYPDEANPGLKYRKRAERLCDRIAEAIMNCGLKGVMSDMQRSTVRAARNQCLGELLLWTGGSGIAKRPLLDALRDSKGPESVWRAPAIFFALAYDHAANGRAAEARRSLAHAVESRGIAMRVSSLLELWLDLYLPVRYERDKERHSEALLKAWALLDELARERRIPVVAHAASRLAAVVAQHSRDIEVGLHWLDEMRKGLEGTGLYTAAAKREYHRQRTVLYNHFHMVDLGLEEVNQALQYTLAGSAYWYLNISLLVHLLLRSGKYAEAARTATEALKVDTKRKREGEFAFLMRVRLLYARVLTVDKRLKIETLSIVDRPPLDALVLRLLFGCLRKKEEVRTDAVESLRRHVARTKALRTFRPMWLLTRLLTMLSAEAFKLDKCRLNDVFCAYEAELKSDESTPRVDPMITPLAIWTAIVNA